MTTTTAAQMVGSAMARVATVTPEDAREEITRGDAVVLDVREPIEWEEHIEGAVQVPRGILEFQADPASPAHNPALEPDRRVIVVCRSGTRATLAAATLMDLGFTDVVNLVGGMNAWKKAGLPTAEAHGAL
jgi:rhodanese-related sulfurtransferase